MELDISAVATNLEHVALKGPVKLCLFGQYVFWYILETLQTKQGKTLSLRPMRIRSCCHFPSPPKGMWSRLPGATGWHACMPLPVMNGSLCGPEFPSCPLMSLRKARVCRFLTLYSTTGQAVYITYPFMLEHVGGSSRCRVPRGLLLVRISGAFHHCCGFGAYAGAGASSSSSSS